MKDFKEYEKALDRLGIVSRFTIVELKKNYQQLSKKYHPDMLNGDDSKFREINEAYKLILHYIREYRYGVDEKDFYEQKPFLSSTDWFYDIS